MSVFRLTETAPEMEAAAGEQAEVLAEEVPVYQWQLERRSKTRRRMRRAHWLRPRKA